MMADNNSGETVIRAQGLSKSFGTSKAVDNVDLSVGRGRLMGIIGPDGAGKTTLMRLLAGVLRAESGKVSVSGRLGYVPQTFSLYQDMSLDENLDFYGTLYGLMGAGLKEQKEKVLDFVDLKRFRERLAGNLSGGMKQRLALAVALIHDPSVIIMDEPTNGVDPVARKELWRVVRNLVDGGSGALVSTQYLEEGELCDTVALMARGRIAAYGTPGELKALLPVKVWQVALDKSSGDGTVADRFEVAEAAASLPGVSHVRRRGAWVRFFADDAQGRGSFESLRKGLDSRGFDDLHLEEGHIGLQDVYVWITVEGGGDRG